MNNKDKLVSHMVDLRMRDDTFLVVEEYRHTGTLRVVFKTTILNINNRTQNLARWLLHPRDKVFPLKTEDISFPDAIDLVKRQKMLWFHGSSKRQFG